MTHTESAPTLTLTPQPDGRYRVFEANAIFTWPQSGQAMRIVSVFDFGTDGVKVRAIPQRKAGGDYRNNYGVWINADALPDGWNEAVLDAIAVHLPDVDFTPAPDASQVPDEGEAWVQDRAPQPTPFDERALADTDAIIDMTGAFVQSTAAVLAIRAAVQYRADQAQARYLATQHGSYEVGRGRAMVARDTWREALALIDTVIAERMS